MAKIDRSTVYQALDSERAYQISQAKSPERPDMVPVLSVGESLTVLQTILTQAEEAYYYGSGDHPAAMELLRKMGGVIVQAGENFGMPNRTGF